MALDRDEVRDHLYDKVDEWLDTVDLGSFGTDQEAEQAFKEWLWGTSHG